MEPAEIIFDTFGEAMDVHTKIFKMLKETGFVTYADLLYMAQNDPEVEYPNDYYNYGWVNLLYTKVEPRKNYSNDNWVLSLPKPKKISMKKYLIK